MVCEARPHVHFHTHIHSREIIQSKVPWWAFTLLNITFISFIQSVLLFSLAAPAYPILLSIQFQPDLTLSDIVLVIFQVGLITTEWFADQQQWGKPKMSTQVSYLTEPSP